MIETIWASSWPAKRGHPVTTVATGSPKQAGRRPRVRSSQQSEIAELASQALRHPGGTGRRPVEVFRRALRLEIAPALKCPERPRLGEHQRRLEHQPAAADAVPVPERPQVEEPLTAQDLPADHPIERAAGDQLGGALGHHAGGMPMLERQLAPFLLLQFLADPVAQIPDAVAADAKLDEMQGHARSALGGFWLDRQHFGSLGNL